MRSQLGNKVRAVFSRELTRQLPQFRRISVQLPPGYRAYYSQVGSLHCYIILCIDRERDSFTIECAWSTSGQFPSQACLAEPRDWPERRIMRDQPSSGQFRFRLARLWETQDLWWHLVPSAHVAKFTAESSPILNPMPVERATAGIQSMVDNCISRIREHAIPYFEAVAEGTARGDDRPDLAYQPG
jgi:hypothetical protein